MSLQLTSNHTSIQWLSRVVLVFSSKFSSLRSLLMQVWQRQLEVYLRYVPRYIWRENWGIQVLHYLQWLLTLYIQIKLKFNFHPAVSVLKIYISVNIQIKLKFNIHPTVFCFKDICILFKTFEVTMFRLIWRTSGETWRSRGTCE